MRLDGEQINRIEVEVAKALWWIKLPKPERDTALAIGEQKVWERVSSQYHSDAQFHAEVALVVDGVIRATEDRPRAYPSTEALLAILNEPIQVPEWIKETAKRIVDTVDARPVIEVGDVVAPIFEVMPEQLMIVDRLFVFDCGEGDGEYAACRASIQDEQKITIWKRRDLQLVTKGFPEAKLLAVSNAR